MGNEKNPHCEICELTFPFLSFIDFFYYKEHLFIVCELLKQNLYEFYKYNKESGALSCLNLFLYDTNGAPLGEPKYFTLPRLRRVAKQCLVAIDYMHNLGIIILFKNEPN